MGRTGKSTGSGTAWHCRIILRKRPEARGETPVNSVEERISNFRKRIAERQAKEGKNYLSFYSVTADSYEIL